MGGGEGAARAGRLSSFMHLSGPSRVITLVHKPPMIYTALCIMFWMCAYSLLGQAGGGCWPQKSRLFMGLKWHSPNGSTLYQKTQKSLNLQGPTPSHLPSYWICSKPSRLGCINHRSINSYYILPFFPRAKHECFFTIFRLFFFMSLKKICSSASQIKCYTKQGCHFLDTASLVQS